MTDITLAEQIAAVERARTSAELAYRQTALDRRRMRDRLREEADRLAAALATLRGLEKEVTR